MCRQLGFPFGGIYDVGEFRQSEFIPGDYEDEFYTDDYDSGVAFATEVTCTGKEARLDECFLPEAFGASDPSVTGVQATCTTQRRRIFSVICRRFEITGACRLSHCCVMRQPTYSYVEHEQKLTG